MHNQTIERFRHHFDSRLDTLSHLLDLAEEHFAEAEEPILHRRLAPDMYPFGTQIAFTCNQPRGFALWCLDQEHENLNPEVDSFEQAREHIASTKALLAKIHIEDDQLANLKRIELGPEMYVELPGLDYVLEFLIPNFYFHLTTAYDILRMAGAPIGKGNYMRHLFPFIKKNPV